MSARAFRIAAIIVALTAAACSSGAGEQPAGESIAQSTTEAAPGVSIEIEPVVPESRPVLQLEQVCPHRIVIQVSGLPTPRLGPLYTLLAPGAEIADDGRSVSGPLRRPGRPDDDVILEIRTGGPSVSFLPAIEVGANDASIHLVTTSIAHLARRLDSKASAVLTLSESNDRMLMWSSVAQPGVSDLDDLGSSGVEIRHVTDELFIEFLVAKGVLDPNQLVPGGSDAIAAFISEAGGIARQGDSIIDPLLFATLPEWSGPLTIGEASSRGWLDIEPVLATTGDNRLESSCLDQIVPAIQQAIPIYAADPVAVNQLMSEIGEKVDPFSLVSFSVMNAAAETLTVAESPGTFDLERVEAFLPALASAIDADVRTIDDIIQIAHLDPTD